MIKLTIERMFPGSLDTSKNVLTIMLDNVPGALAAEGLLVNFGGYDAAFRRQAFSTQSKMAIEVNIPRNIGPGKVTMVVKSLLGATSWSATSDFNFIDPQYVLISLEKSPLVFPSSGAQPFTVSVSNLPVSEFEAADVVAVSFAGVSAQLYSIQSIVGNLMTLLVTPPAYTISSTDGGSSTVLMTVSLRSDPSIFAEMPVEFYGIPTFSAEFDGKGTSIILIFDQITGTFRERSRIILK
jgi:hypothetical protein